MSDLQVFGTAFRDQRTWRAWEAFLAALFGLSMTPAQRQLFNECTGGRAPPQGGTNEAWLVCGRRSGKSFTLSLIAVYLACFRDWRPYLTAGERGTIMIIASDRKQARTIMSYIKGLLQSVDMLAATIEGETAESISLTNKVTIEIHTASFKTVRGYTIVAALLDEIAFWPTDELAADPDTEVINALKPAMATIPGAMLLCASSPYARKGALWSAYQKHYGKNSKVLVWQAATRVMNCTVPQAVVDDALSEDPSAASAEWLAIFRSDVEGYVTLEVVRACTSVGVHERPPERGVGYRGYVDMASGSGSDAACLAIAHRDNDRAVLDVLREVRPPFSAEQTVQDFAAVLRNYGLSRCTGDKYGAGLTVELFMRSGIRYVDAAKSTSDTYLDFLPALNSKLVDLLDSPRLAAQLVGLERRPGRARDSISHGRNGHDDLATATSGALCACLNRRRWELAELHPVGVPVVFEDGQHVRSTPSDAMNLNYVSTAGSRSSAGDDIRHGGRVTWANRLTDW
jgi:hypothetical protein